MLAPLIALAAVLTVPPSPAGMEVRNSDCCAGTDWFFFADEVVISKDSSGLVGWGHWRLDGDAVLVATERVWDRKGAGRVLYVANEGDVHERYVAVTEARDPPIIKRLSAAEFQPADPAECGGARPHHRPEDPHAFLRLFDGEHPETFQRLLRPEELEGKSAAELRLMRNEIFARYGLRFRDPALRGRFERLQVGRDGAEPRLVAVDAWLTDVERENVDLLAAAEAKAR